MVVNVQRVQIKTGERKWKSSVGASAKEGKGVGGGEKKISLSDHCSFGKLRTLASAAPD